MKKVILFASVVSVMVAGAWAGCSSDTSSGNSGGSGGSGEGAGGPGGPTSTASHSASASSGSPTSTGASMGGAGGMTVVSVDCNPVTNEGCAAGEACDAAADMGGNPSG